MSRLTSRSFDGKILNGVTVIQGIKTDKSDTTNRFYPSFYLFHHCYALLQCCGAHSGGLKADVGLIV
jgi:hypothetical protein